MQHRHRRPAAPPRTSRPGPHRAGARPTASRRLQVVAGACGLIGASGVLLPLAAGAVTPTVLATYVGVPGVAGADAAGGPPTGTHLETPAGLVTDAAGDLYVADPGAHDVVEVVGAHTWVVAGIPGVTAGHGDVTPGVATGRALVTPTGLALLPDGTLLIADPGAHVVWRLSAGALSVFAGTGFAGPAAAGVATAEPMEAPTGLAVDLTGTVYVSDSTDETIWSVSGGLIAHLAGSSGVAGYAGDGGAPAQVLFHDPQGLAWSAPAASASASSGHLLVADAGNSRVRGVSGAGATGVAAGPLGLSAPTGLLAQADGTVLVADAGDGRVLRLSGGTLTMLAGTGTNGLSADGSTAAHASLDQPTALAVVGPGRFLVAETGGSVVRSVGPALSAPAQPVAPAVVVGDGRATVSWSAPDTGGSPITGWVLREYAATGPATSITVVGSTSIIVQGLADGQPYRFTVAAVNAQGTSPESAPSATVVPGPPRTGGNGPAVPLPVIVSSPAPAPSATASAAPTPMPSALPRPVRRAVPAPVLPQTTPQPPAVSGAPVPPDATVPADLVPVHSLADAATDVVTVTRKTAIPLVLVALLVAFLLSQGFLDRRDRTLSLSPLYGDPGLDFEAV